AYHVLCDGCANEKGVCAKCMEAEEIVEGHNPKTSQQRVKEQQELEQKLGSMRERQRRSYLRKLKRGDIVAADIPDVCNSDDEDFDYTDGEDNDDEEDGDDSDEE
ncbi:hypothetical protein GGI21_005141, partial [Coemansia aciculifera]